MQTRVQAVCALHCLSHAACKGRFKGRLCEDVAEQRRFSVNIGCAAKGQGEETCCKGMGCRKGEQGRPAGGEGRNAGTAGGSRDSPRAEAREKSDKGGSFSAPAAPELKSEDDKLASRRLSELWVGALLGFARECECSSGGATCGPAGGTSRSQGGDECSVNCKLRAPPERKPVSNDFNAALILPGGLNIEISKPDVEGNGGSGLSADAGSSALEGPAPGAKDA